MSPWTALLESLHSALVDELNVRDPKTKPELGLPERRSAWGLPAGAEGVLVTSVELKGGGQGVTALAWGAGSRATPTAAKARELRDAVFKRAGSEFARRGIQPRLGGVTELAASASLPAGIAAPGRVIWIPLKAPGYAYFLGIGAP